jgi:hypothetical protein
MKRTRVLALAATALTTTLIAAPSAHGQEFTPMDVTPTSGPAGTTVSVSGRDCVYGTVDIAFAQPGDGEWIDIATAYPSGDGDWSHQFAVPAVDPDAEWSVYATCWIDEFHESPDFDYQPTPFDVTGGSTSTTVPPEIPTPTEPVTVTPQAAPAAAAAVVAQPDFAG